MSRCFARRLKIVTPRSVRGPASRFSKNSAAPKKHPRCNGQRLDSRPFLPCKWRSRRVGKLGSFSLQRSSAIAWEKLRLPASPEFFLSRKQPRSSRSERASWNPADAEKERCSLLDCLRKKPWPSLRGTTAL